MAKRNGYVWGMLSVILSSCSIASPFLGVIIGSMAGLPVFLEPIFQILFLFLPPIGFIFAFIGKVRCENGTEARKLCNIGAGIGIVMSAILIWSMAMVLLQDFFSLTEEVAAVTGLIDMILIAGYFLIAYIKDKLLWFV